MIDKYLIDKEASEHDREKNREDQRMSMRTDLEVLSSFDFIITTSTRGKQRGRDAAAEIRKEKQQVRAA